MSDIEVAELHLLRHLEAVGRKRGAKATMAAVRATELLLSYFHGDDDAPDDDKVDAALSALIGGQKGKSTGARLRLFAKDFLYFASQVRKTGRVGSAAVILQMRARDLADPAFGRLDLRIMVEALARYVLKTERDMELDHLVSEISDLAIHARAFGATDATAASDAAKRKFRKTVRENLASMKNRR